MLTRGNTLRPRVLLLGGPNTYIAGWSRPGRRNIPKIWEERNYELPKDVDPEDLINVPQNAQYFAAIGAVEFGKDEPRTSASTRARRPRRLHQLRRLEEKKKAGGRAREGRRRARPRSSERYKRKKFVPATFEPGQVVEGFIGLDGGSTSTKAVLARRGPRRAGQDLSALQGQPHRGHEGGPRQDQKQVDDAGATLEVMGFGTTGYAKDILKDTLAPTSTSSRPSRTPSRRCSSTATST